MLRLPGYVIEKRAPLVPPDTLLHGIRVHDSERVLLKLYGGPLESVWERGQRELEMLARIESEHVPRGLELEQHRDRVVLALSHMPGGLLREHLDSGGGRDPVGFLRVATQLARVVADVHASGIVLRDLNPHRVLVCPDTLQVSLVDLGGALSGQPGERVVTDIHSLKVSLLYMAPERAGRMGRAVETRSDLYSLGVILYELLVGQPPFETLDLLELIHAHMTVVPLPPDQVDVEISPVLSHLVMTLLEKMPEDRYQSAAALYNDLRALELRLEMTGSLADAPLGGPSVPAELRLPAPVYGREQARARVRAALDRARGGVPQLVLLSGSHGIGKSALVEELAGELGGNCYLAQGKCDPVRREVPHAVFRSAFGALIEQIVTESDARLATWREALSAALGNGADALLDIVPQLDLILDQLDDPPDLGPFEIRNRLLLACRRFVTTVAGSADLLVLFLDDLQWADSGSLQVVEAILDSEAQVAIIGAFCPDSEAPALSSFLTRMGVTCDEVEREQDLDRGDSDAGPVTVIPLRPLPVPALERLLADMLACSPGEAAPLAVLVARKTGGNPFLVEQFLEYAHRRGLFTFDAGGWHWDLGALAAADIPDDAVGLMTARLNLLDPDTRAILDVASCIGGRFDRDTLEAALACEPAALNLGLCTLEEHGLLASAGSEFRFAHDEIREAVYADLPVSRREAYHLSIGRFLLERAQAAVGEAALAHIPNLFVIVEQLDDALALIDEDLRLDLAQLNLDASVRALRAVAYRPARRYAEAGCHLVADEPWDAHDRLRYRLWLEHAESALLSGDADTADALLRDLADATRGRADALALALRKVRMYRSAGRDREGVDIALAALRADGVRVGGAPGAVALIAQLAITNLALTGRSGTLDHLPETEDPGVVARMALLEAVLPAAFMVSMHLYLALMLLGVRWTLRHGITPGAPAVLAMMSMLAVGSGRFRQAHQMARVVRSLEQRAGPRAGLNQMTPASFVVELWFRDIRDVDAEMREAFQSALEFGRLDLAIYTEAARVQFQLFRGTPLEQLTHDTRVLERLCAQDGAPELGAAWAHFARVLATLTEGLPVTDLVPSQAALTSTTARAGTDYVEYNNACFVLGIMGEWTRAFELAEQVNREVRRAFFGLPHLRLYYLFHALGAAEVHRASADGRTRRRCWRVLRSRRRALRRWARHTRVHAPHYLALVEAEVARVRGSVAEAMRQYAIASAHAAEEDAFPLQALADERRALLALEQGWSGDASAFLRLARDGYRRWGAQAKLRQLHINYGDLLADEGTRALSSGGGDDSETLEMSMTVGGAIDLATVMEVSRAISEELTLDRVLERVMQSALENAGASKAVLLLVDDGKLRVEAEISSDGGFVRHRAIPHDEAGGLIPLSVVRYVERTGRSVIAGDVGRERRFSRDPYLNGHRCRAVLCMPIRRQTRLSGVLYLENRFASDVFVRDRVEVLRLLSAQAAIAIDSARLYDQLAALNLDLEHMVNERTAELAQANAELKREIDERKRAQDELLALQKKLVDTARAAGMAEIATGVLHNVGNALNSVNVSVELLQERVSGSRLPALSQALGLMRANAGALDAFIADDPRGQRLLQYLDMLAERLAREHEESLSELRDLQRHLEHIAVIVRKQQHYAKRTSAVEVCHIDEILGDALTLAGASFTHHGVTVVVEGDDTPPVEVDRHKTVQILTNLLTNAEQAVRATGSADKRITVSTRVGGADRVIVQVVDNGVGISAEHLDKLFNYGFTTRPDGHGFGLHNSYLAARSMHATLRAYSDGPGQGATFELELPAAPAAVDEREQQPLRDTTHHERTA
ncbi:trifunctional serine/threonine-protein kinase/ATP-binding protein/sensor histidine kinase [Haliangium sp.]|uniref:trifunctional serine/threonine-protein kinase/ATP-binding protein/sensor histidine kinase n=1 Tax=Haliangium sp. TaxID=2663208 RepID=UPI003D11F8D2